MTALGNGIVTPVPLDLLKNPLLEHPVGYSQLHTVGVVRKYQIYMRMQFALSHQPLFAMPTCPINPVRDLCHAVALFPVLPCRGAEFHHFDADALSFVFGKDEVGSVAGNDRCGIHAKAFEDGSRRMEFRGMVYAGVCRHSAHSLK